MFRKFFKIFIVIAITLTIIPCSISADENVIVDPTTGFTYTLVEDNDERRVINYFEEGYEITITYDKVDQKLIVDKTKDGKTSTLVISSSPMTRTMFSPWNYTVNGNTYTLTAVIDGETKTKTRVRTSSNSANIDRFCDAVDDMVSTEWDIIGSVGLDLIFPIIGAFFTGGVTLIAALAAIGAGAGTLAQADHLNELYDRAREAFLAL